MEAEHVPVLIIGSGLAGTSAAMFLGLHGINPLLVERHPSTSNQPKARGQSWHTMEALRIAGVHERVREAGYDVNIGMPIVIANSVAGPIVHEIMGEQWPDIGHLTQEHMAMASQERTEPILLERARELGATARFSTRVDSIEPDEDGVTAWLTELETGREYRVRADYVLAADGWRSPTREALGIGVHGRGALSHSVSVVFEADLAELVHGREFALFYLRGNPELGDGATFASTDTPGRWVLNLPYSPERGETPDDFTEARILAGVRAATGRPELAVRIVNAAPTTLAHRVADRFSAGRVHLLGDAAHVMPPHGGQGGNTAVLDGFHLAWKLAGVLHGWAGSGLLDSHDAECRPYGELIAGQQYSNMVFRSAPHLADGTEDEIVPPLRPLLGYRYPNGAIVPEPGENGALLEDPETANGRPGSRAPHVWLAEGSIHDLFGREFVLLTASETWAKTAESVAEELGVPLRAHVLDDGDWSARYGIGEAGASLVRPDRFVAWRTTLAGTAEELTTALRTVLAR